MHQVRTLMPDFQSGEKVIVRFPSGREVRGTVSHYIGRGRYDVIGERTTAKRWPFTEVHNYPKSWLRKAAA